MSDDRQGRVRWILTLAVTRDTAAGQGAASGWRRQVVCTVAAQRDSCAAGDRDNRDRTTTHGSLAGDFRRYFSSFLSGASYRDIL